MKRCPTCNKTFSDQNLSYCLDDGTPLVSASSDDAELPATGPGGGWPSPDYQPPSYVPPGTGEKRKTWPWVAGLIALLVLALGGLTFAAAVLIPRVLKKPAPVIVSRRDNNTANPPANENSNPSVTKPAETNTNEDSSSNAAAPTDKDLVLATLRDLEHEWMVANLNADKKKLSQILADDYVGKGNDGSMQGKAEYINTVDRDTSVQKWDFEDLRLTLHGDRATLIGQVNFTIQDKEVLYDFVDKFVWRDGRWQATGSEVNLHQ
jgi:hypothetical protein